MVSQRRGGTEDGRWRQLFVFYHVWVFSHFFVNKTSFGVANLSCLCDGNVGTKEAAEEESFLCVLNSSRK